MILGATGVRGEEGGMGYSLEEVVEGGSTITLGDPFFDLMVAKVIASQRARRTGRVIIVSDVRAGCEVARYEPSAESVNRLRVASSLISTRPKAWFKRWSA